MTKKILFKFFVFGAILLNTTIIFGASLDNYPQISTNEPITAIPYPKNLNKAKIALGEKLFNDKQLSVDGSVSCSSCHILSNAGIDSLPLAIGVKGRIGVRNTPTVLNSSLLFTQFWDGRVQSLALQVAGPLINNSEMANNWDDILQYLQSDPSYELSFRKIYSQISNEKNVSDAIAEFEKSLLTPNSPFDQYLKGDNNAIDKITKEGYQLFKSFGCISCHQGVAIGGNLFQKLGVVIPYYENIPKNISQLGRYAITKKESDKFVFKVPSLRNVAKTAPYFHDGSIATLKQAITIMSVHQIGRPISEKESHAIELFLISLNGEVIAQ